METAAPRYYRERERTGKLGFGTRVAQGVGALPDTFKAFAFNVFLLFYYNQVLGVSALAASTAIGAALIIDAFFDPLVGSFSDNLKTKWGRRHPLMYASALPLGISLYCVFMPPAGLTGDGLTAWLFAFAVLTHMSMSLFLVPWSALYAEFSDDYSERTTLVSYRYALGWIGGLLFVGFVYFGIFATSPEYPQGQLNPSAYQPFAIVLSISAALAVLATTYFTQREAPYLLQPVERGALFDPLRLFRELRDALSNREFLILFVTSLLAAAVSGTVVALGIYLNTYFWQFATRDLGWFAFASFGAALGILTVGLIEARLDKKYVVIGTFALLVLDGSVVIGLRLLEILPPNGNPALLWILVGNEIFRTYLSTILLIMFASMIADTLDVQELKTGRRQEGLFAAALSFSGKATAGVGAVVAGFLLEVVLRWPPQVRPADMPADKITELGVVAGILLPALYAIPLLLAFRYRITRAVFGETRAALAAKRAAEAGAAA